MFEINHPDEVAELARRKKILSVILTDFRSTQTDWVLGNWKQLHHDSGNAWHICVPTHSYRDKEPTRRYAAGSIDYGVSRQLSTKYRIASDRLPCLVFDNYQIKDKQRFISLKEMTESELAGLFRRTSEYFRIAQNDKKWGNDPADMIANLVRQEKSLQSLSFETAMAAFSIILGIASFLK